MTACIRSRTSAAPFSPGFDPDPITVIGTDGPNVIRVLGPADALVRGRGGDDVIRTGPG